MVWTSATGLVTSTGLEHLRTPAKQALLGGVAGCALTVSPKKVIRVTSMNDFFHHHKKRIQPGATPERLRYVRREGKHSEKTDLVSTGTANLPPGIGCAAEFCKLLARNERKNGGLYEHEIALPRVLSSEQCAQLGKELAMAIAGNSPVIWGVHCPPAAMERGKQPHAHILTYPKVPDGIPRAEPQQVFKRYDPIKPERGGWKKDCGGATRGEVVEKLKSQRAGACAIANRFLDQHGFEQRLDHRSYAERGIDKVPGKHLGPYKVRKLLKEAESVKSLSGLT
jgi:hypothetical protein